MWAEDRRNWYLDTNVIHVIIPIRKWQIHEAMHKRAILETVDTFNFSLSR